MCTENFLSQLLYFVKLTRFAEEKGFFDMFTATILNTIYEFYNLLFLHDVSKYRI